MTAATINIISATQTGNYRIRLSFGDQTTQEVDLLHDMKGKHMKKAEEMRTEYLREELGKGVRGKHYEEFKKGSNLVLLTPELSRIFPTNEAVNAALNSLVGIARSATGPTSRLVGRATKRRTA